MKRVFILVLFTLGFAFTANVSADSSIGVTNSDNNLKVGTSTSTFIAPDILVSSDSNIVGGSLVLTNLPNDASLVYTSVPGISVSYNSSKKVYTFTGTTTALNYQTLFRSFKLNSSTTTTTDLTASFTVNVGTGSAFYNSSTGHYYEFVTGSLTWDQAKTAAEGRTFNERQGYLATITSQEENDFISEKVNSDGWIGASDIDTEGTWIWKTGPEAGTQFWAGDAAAGDNSTSNYGSAIPGQYSNWGTSEPNNAYSLSGSPVGEDHAHMMSSGYWNDYHSSQSIGYIVEYGGLVGETITGDYSETISITIEQTYTVEFLNHDSTVHYSSIHFSGDDLSSYTLPSNPTRDGYAFNGWDASVPSTMPSNNVTINPTWVVADYFVRWYDYSGNLITEVEKTSGDDLTEVSHPVDPSQQDQVFTGWSVEIPDTMPSNNLNIYSEWKDKEYKIQWVYGVVVKEEVFLSGDDTSHVTNPFGPRKLGYSFIGWDTEVPATMPSSDIIISPLFTINEYTITWVDYDGYIIDTLTVAYGQDLRSINNPVVGLEGHTFSEWSRELPETMVHNDIVLVAKYEVNEYEITYMVNDDVYMVASFEFGEKIQLPIEPSKAGYEFLYWSEKEELTPYIIGKMPSQDTVLVAKFRDVEQPIIADVEDIEINESFLNELEIPEVLISDNSGEYTLEVIFCNEDGSVIYANQDAFITSLQFHDKGVIMFIAEDSSHNKSEPLEVVVTVERNNDIDEVTLEGTIVDTENYDPEELSFWERFVLWVKGIFEN